MIKDKILHYFAWLLNRPIIRNITPSSWYIKIRFYEHLNKKLNLDSPETFNEKLQWLKVNNRKNEYTQMVDKFRVRNFVREKIGPEYLIPLVGGPWRNADEIEYSELPDKFVLKCNHDSASVVICKDKKTFDIYGTNEKLNKALKFNYYWLSREWPYKNIVPCIIAEKYMEDESEQDLKDYKFFCFNGVVKFYKIDFDRFTNHHANYYDCEGHILPFGEEICPPDFNRKLEIPQNINEMILLAAKLSKGIPFVRIDFYNINGKIYFGEITFFPAAGFGKFIPDEWDKILGDWIKI